MILILTNATVTRIDPQRTKENICNVELKVLLIKGEINGNFPGQQTIQQKILKKHQTVVNLNEEPGRRTW